MTTINIDILNGVWLHYKFWYPAVVMKTLIRCRYIGKIINKSNIHHTNHSIRKLLNRKAFTIKHHGFQSYPWVLNYIHKSDWKWRRTCRSSVISSKINKSQTVNLPSDKSMAHIVWKNSSSPIKMICKRAHIKDTVGKRKKYRASHPLRKATVQWKGTQKCSYNCR